MAALVDGAVTRAEDVAAPEETCSPKPVAAEVLLETAPNCGAAEVAGVDTVAPKAELTAEVWEVPAAVDGVAAAAVPTPKEKELPEAPEEGCAGVPKIGEAGEAAAPADGAGVDNPKRGVPEDAPNSGAA